MMKKKRIRNNIEGFTLVEVLVAIIILGILASVAALSLNTSVGRANQKACRLDFKTINIAVDAYYNDFNSYTSSLVTLQDNGYLSSDSSIIAATPNNYLQRERYRIYYRSTDGVLGVGIGTAGVVNWNSSLECNKLL